MDTMHQCIQSMCLLSRWFCTDKANLRYKQLTRQYGKLYIDYLKVGVCSVRKFIGGTIYTNKLGLNKFFPFIKYTPNKTGHTLYIFIDIVGLPYYLHSYNHINFKEGLFKQTLQKSGIFTTYTEPHSQSKNRAVKAIGEVKQMARKLIIQTNTHIWLWYFCQK